jgi:hypothetical protein
MSRNRSIMRVGLASLLLVLATLLAGPAQAADGRLLAAAGEVTVDRPEAGGLRSIPVDAGFELQSGDTIRTGAQGRAQIRLSDGAIFSLQPRTVFRIDEYRFDAQEQRGFFSLLRGALRTATGRIGKRDHDDYRLQTPTATVGIRGTQYMAQETVCDPGCWPGDRAGLHVSVTEGRIAVTNDFGSIEIGAGEAARVAPASAPRRAALPPQLPPQQMLADGEDDSSDGDSAGSSSGPVAQGSASADDGTGPGGPPAADAGANIAGTAGATNASAAPLRTAEATGTDGPVAGPQTRRKPARRQNGGDWDDTLLARIDNTAAGDEGNSAAGDGAGETDPLSPGDSGRVFDIDFAPNSGRDDSGDLLAVNEAVGSTDPSGNGNGNGNGNSGDGEPGTGEPGNGGPGNGGPGNGGPGNGGPGNGEPGDGGPGNGEPGDGEPGDGGPGNGEPGDGEPGDGGPGNGEPGDGEPGDGGPGNGEPGDGEPGDGGPGNGEPGDGEIPPGGETTTGLWRVDLRQFLGSQPIASLAVADGRLQFDAERRLTSIGYCPGFLCLSSGSTRIAEAGADQWVSWGRWTEGNAIMQIVGVPFAIPYSANTGMHYLVGSPALTVPTAGEFTYALAGATAPTMSGGQWAPGSFTGNASVRFDPGQAARLGLEGNVTFDEASFRFATQGGAANPGASEVTFDSRHAFDATIGASQTGGGSDFCGRGDCSTRISGGLFGPTGERLGVGYTINGANGSTTIDGVGVFTRQ